jgi:two-component system, NarL family, nitrate/nitrite response regulator NarL
MSRAAAHPRRASWSTLGLAGDRVATVVLGDDHVVFLDALATVLSQHGHEVCGVARNATELVTLVRMHQPDLCLIDHNASADGDTRIIGRVMEASAGTSVLVLSSSPCGQAVSRALDAGASGYLHQSRGVGELVTAIERVLNGETVVDVPEIAPSRRPAEPNQALRMAAHLTSRERECLMMLVEGLDTAAMVDLLGVSRTTVRTHLQSVLTKLGVHSRLEAASFAVRHRLPDVWSGGNVAATAGPANGTGTVRGTGTMRSAGAVRGARTVATPVPAQATSMIPAISTVRPIRPRRVEAARELAEERLPVAAGQGASAG